MTLNENCRAALKNTPWQNMMIWLRVNMIRQQVLANNRLES